MQYKVTSKQVFLRSLVIALVIALALVLISPGARAQDTFEQIAKQCVADTNKQLGRETKGDMWTVWAKCAIERAYPSVPHDRVDACIKAVWQRRWQQNVSQQHGEPVYDAARCAISRAS